MKPIAVDDVKMAFPGDITNLMPAYDGIPKEFKSSNHKMCRIASYWFFNGLNPKTKFTVREGIDPKLAFRHLHCILGSFQPKHEHKEAAVAYLLDQWFSDVQDYEKPEKKD